MPMANHATDLEKMVEEGLITYKDAFNVLKQRMPMPTNSEIITMLNSIQQEIDSTCQKIDDKSDDWCPYGCRQSIDVYEDPIAEIFAHYIAKLGR